MTTYMNRMSINVVGQQTVSSVQPIPIVLIYASAHYALQVGIISFSVFSAPHQIEDS